MKRILPLLALAVLSLTGCGSVFFVNVGGVARTAATTGPAMAPEVQCAALATPSISGATLDIKAVNICDAAVAAQKALDEKKGKK